MAAIFTDRLVQQRQTPSHELVMRAMHEFDDLPALCLTLEQAMRLFSLDRATCLAVLGELEKACFIRCDKTGRYRRVAIQH